MYYGYVTTANKRQISDSQKELILRACPDAVIVKEAFENGTDPDGFYPAFSRFIEKARPGDVLLAVDPEKLADSPEMLEKVLYKLNVCDLKWEFIKMPFLNYDFYASRKMSLNDACAQILEAYQYLYRLHEVHKMNRRKGAAQAELSGVKMGRPSGLTGQALEKYELLREALLHRGYATDREIMEKIGLSNNTFYKYKKLLKEETMSRD